MEKKVEGKISITPLLNAQAIFEQFRQGMEDDRDKAGATQAFEFCYELSWKMMNRVLEERGMRVGSPQSTFRHATLESLIEDPEIWFEFQKKRNLTVHTYDKAKLEDVVSIFALFSQELAKLVDALQKAI